MAPIPVKAQHAQNALAAADALLAAINENAERAGPKVGNSQNERSAHAATAAQLGQALDAVTRLLAVYAEGNGLEGEEQQRERVTPHAQVDAGEAEQDPATEEIMDRS